MPELPEVETIRKDLQKKIIGKKIIAVCVVQKNSVKNSPGKFTKNLKNHSIEEINRKGKLLVLKIKGNDSFLLVHLRMTGQLLYYQAREEAKNNTRVIFLFDDNSELFFNDTRRFGYLQIVTEKEKDEALAKMGIDILDKSFSLKILHEILKKNKRTLKAVLLDQKIMSGIGNIYADEICFEARLRPDKITANLTNKEIEKLYDSTIKIIKLALKNRGTTFSDYRDSDGKKGHFSKFLKVYQKEKEICQNCHQPSIKKIKVAGRATRYCQNCQN